MTQNSAYQHAPVAEVAAGKSAPQGSAQPTATVTEIGDRYDRMRALRTLFPAAHGRVESFIDLSKRGLPYMYLDDRFVHTVRAVQTSVGEVMRLEGDNLRYTTKCALGLALVDIDTQRKILNGRTAAELALATIPRAERVTDDPGVVALAAWAAAEAADHNAQSLFKKLEEVFASSRPMATVDCAWTLIAALAARHLADTALLARQARDRLLANQGASGLFPHMLPANAAGRLRAHVGSFADQVYPTQALSRYSVAMNDPASLRAADACGAKICQLQGPAGQWWWHYNAPHGSIVEGYPVYSVHQHGMGPMALLDLREAGGRDHLRSVALGLGWIDNHPEVAGAMIDETRNVIWRKAGRREPRKATRAISAATTSIHPKMKMPGLDAVFPPNLIDRECRPYELGWLLYAWLGGGVVQRLRTRQSAMQR